MHSALFVAAIPSPPTHQSRLEWKTYLTMIASKVRIGEGVSRLGENIWLVNMRKAPSALAYLASMATDQNIAYGILPFQQAPEWLPDAFDPNTIQA